MDLKNVCRTCLRNPKNAINLFEDSSKLLDKIWAISQIQIEDINELPNQICEECVKNINYFYNFQKVIVNSENDLKQRLETLKNTFYTCKPRSKIKLTSSANESTTECNLDVKNESFSDNEANENDHGDYVSDEDDIVMKKALAMKKIFKCNVCKAIFQSKYTLTNHKRTEHAPRGICNICGASVRGDNLRKHLRLHSEGPSSCDTCGKTFKNSESLRSHKFVHMEQVYTCEICGKSFKLKSEHTRHLKKHEDPDFRKSECYLCGKKVRELKRHMLTHTGERPYPCNYCQKGFTSTHALKVHTRLHTNEKPYSCDYCVESFPQKVSLVTHLKTKHGRITT